MTTSLFQMTLSYVPMNTNLLGYGTIYSCYVNESPLFLIMQLASSLRYEQKGRRRTLVLQVHDPAILRDKLGEISSPSRLQMLNNITLVQKERGPKCPLFWSLFSFKSLSDFNRKVKFPTGSFRYTSLLKNDFMRLLLIPRHTPVGLLLAE